MAKKLGIKRVQCECTKSAARYRGECAKSAARYQGESRRHKELPPGTDTTVICRDCGAEIKYSVDYWWRLKVHGLLEQCKCKSCHMYDVLRAARMRRNPSSATNFQGDCGQFIRARYVGTGNPCWRCGVYHANWYLTCLDRAATMDWPGWDVGKPDAD